MEKIIASLIFLAGLGALASAQTNAPATRPLSLQDCFAEALQHNLDVQIERTVPEISLYNLKGAYGGFDPQFNLGGTHNYNDQGALFQYGQIFPPTIENNNTFSSGISGLTPWGMNYDASGNISDQHIAIGTNYTSSSGGSFGITLTQPLLKNFWIDNNRLTILVAKNRLKYSEQGLRQQIITTVTAVENAYYELIYARENVQVQRDALALAETQLGDDKQRMVVGTVAERGGTIEQDEAQAAQSRANLIAAQNTLAVDQNTLKTLLTDNYSQWHDVVLEPTLAMTAERHFFDLQDSWGKGMTGRPDLVQARLNVEQQGIQLKFYRNQLFPQLDLTGSYGFNGDGNRPYYSYGGQLTMPLSNIGPRNQLKAGKANEKQLLLQLKQLEQNIMVQIDNAVKNAESAWESVDATRQARLYAEAALKAEEGKYAVGKSTIFVVLQLQSALTTARSQEIRALANYNQSLASLAAAEGSSLQRDNLEIKAK